MEFIDSATMMMMMMIWELTMEIQHSNNDLVHFALFCSTTSRCSHLIMVVVTHFNECLYYSCMSILCAHVSNA